MGRLQRKKDPIKKKSKSSNNHVAGTLPDDNDSASGVVKKASAQVKKTPVSVAKSAGVKKEKNFLDKSLQFLREVKVELKKVTWPSRKQTMGSTVVVIALVILISLFLGLVDMGLSSLIAVVLK